MRSVLVFGLVAVSWFAVMRGVSGRRDTDTYCGGRLRLPIVDELSYEVKKVDPKKTIQVCCLDIYADFDNNMYVSYVCMYSDWKFPS